MERYYSKLIGTPVRVEGALRPITTVKGVVMDPESGKVLAFMVDLSRRKIIVPVDIMSFGDVIKIGKHEDVVQVEDVLRVEEVVNDGIKIFGNRVETESGKDLGRVLDFSIDSKMLELRKMYVGKIFLGMLRWNTRLIGPDQIVEVLVDKIVVKDDAATVMEEEEQAVAVGDMAMG